MSNKIPSNKIVNDFMFELLKALNEKYIIPTENIEVDIRIMDEEGTAFSNHSLSINHKNTEIDELFLEE